MRKSFPYWFLGLVSVGSIAGCGSISDFREQPNEGGCASTSGPELWSTCQATHPASTSTDAPNMQGRSGFAWFENAEETAPPHPQAIVTAKHLPERTPSSKPVEPTATEQLEIVQPTATPPTAPVQASWGTVTEMEKTAASKSVAGHVQQYRNTWRLRYAPIDQEDVYGGVVILDGGAELSQLRDGQRVRVSGVLIPPESRTSSARYRVQAIEMLD
jgi:hypothetical protein